MAKVDDHVYLFSPGIIANVDNTKRTADRLSKKTGKNIEIFDYNQIIGSPANLNRRGIIHFLEDTANPNFDSEIVQLFQEKVGDKKATLLGHSNGCNVMEYLSDFADVTDMVYAADARYRIFNLMAFLRGNSLVKNGARDSEFVSTIRKFHLGAVDTASANAQKSGSSPYIPKLILCSDGKYDHLANPRGSYEVFDQSKTRDTTLVNLEETAHSLLDNFGERVDPYIVGFLSAHDSNKVYAQEKAIVYNKAR